MFLGHFGIALAAKRLMPSRSLGTITAASCAPELIWSALLILGVRRIEISPVVDIVRTPLEILHYPLAGSGTTVLAAGLTIGALSWLFTRQRGASLMLCTVTFTHWLLDAIVQRPDSVTPFSSPLFGSGWWRSITATLALEIIIFVGTVWLYATFTRPRRVRGRDWLLFFFVACLLFIYTANMLVPLITLPAISLQVLAIGGLSGYVVLLTWAAVLDNRRTTPRSKVNPP